MMISIENPTGRQTECRIVTIGDVRLYFSYNTLIGVSDSFCKLHRIDNRWGPTTGRHIRECGLVDAVIVNEDRLQQYAMSCLMVETNNLLF